MSLFKHKQEKRNQPEIDAASLKKFRVTLKSEDIYEVMAEDGKDALNSVLYSPMYNSKAIVTEVDVNNHNSIEVEEVAEG